MSSRTATAAATVRQKQQTPILYAHRGCPFARRVLALVELLGCEMERRVVRVDKTPEGIEHYSKSKRVPLLVDGELVLTESRVMLEHLAERHHFEQAYPADLPARSLQRQAMALVDARLAPLLAGSQVDEGNVELAETLQTLERAIAAAPFGPSLLTLHAAPVCFAFRAWHPAGTVTRALEARPRLHDWLDAVSTLDCFVRTAPDPQTHQHDIALAQQVGLLLDEKRPRQDHAFALTGGGGVNPNRGRRTP